MNTIELILTVAVWVLVVGVFLYYQFLGAGETRKRTLRQTARNILPKTNGAMTKE